jgi:Zn-dependent protease with chaperone function
MEFEPVVIQSIEKNRRRIALCKVSYILLAAAALLVAVGILVAALFVEFAHPAVQEVDKLMLVMIPLAMLTVSVFYTLGIFDGYRKEKAHFENLLEQVVRPASQQLTHGHSLFREALEAVCIAAGIDTPPLDMLDFDWPNSISYLGRHAEPRVGVTVVTLAEHRTPAEAEVMMAHEVSHIMQRDIAKPPRFLEPKRLPLLALCAILFLSAFSSWTAALRGAGLDRILISYQLVGVLLILILWPITYLITRQMDRMTFSSDIMADSVAAKITSSPDVLRKLIREVMDSVPLLKAGQPPTEPQLGQLSRSFFVPPQPASWSAMTDLGEMNPDPSQPASDSRWFKQRYKSENRVSELMQARILNLDAIDDGRWPAFE